MLLKNTQIDGAISAMQDQVSVLRASLQLAKKRQQGLQALGSPCLESSPAAPPAASDQSSRDDCDQDATSPTRSNQHIHHRLGTDQQQPSLPNTPRATPGPFTGLDKPPTTTTTPQPATTTVPAAQDPLRKHSNSSSSDAALDASEQLLIIADKLQQLVSTLSTPSPAAAADLSLMHWQLTSAWAQLFARPTTDPTPTTPSKLPTQQLDRARTKLAQQCLSTVNGCTSARLFSGAAAATPATQLSWFYLDDGSRIRGPHDPATMLRWHCQGYLEDALPICAVVQLPDGTSPCPDRAAFTPLHQRLQQVEEGVPFHPYDSLWEPSTLSGNTAPTAAAVAAGGGGKASAAGVATAAANNQGSRTARVPASSISTAAAGGTAYSDDDWGFDEDDDLAAAAAATDDSWLIQPIAAFSIDVPRGGSASSSPRALSRTSSSSTTSSSMSSSRLQANAAAAALPTPGGPPGRGRAWVQASRLRLQGGPNSSCCDHNAPATKPQQQQQGEVGQFTNCRSQLPNAHGSSRQAETATAAAVAGSVGEGCPGPAVGERIRSNIYLNSSSSSSSSISQLAVPSRLGAISTPVPAMDHPLAQQQQHSFGPISNPVSVKQQQQQVQGVAKAMVDPYIPRTSAQLDASSGRSSPSSSCSSNIGIRPVRSQQAQGVGFSQSRAGQQQQQQVGIAVGSVAAAVAARGAVVTPPRRLGATLPGSPASQSAPGSAHGLAKAGGSFTAAAGGAGGVGTAAALGPAIVKAGAEARRQAAASGNEQAAAAAPLGAARPAAVPSTGTAAAAGAGGGGGAPLSPGATLKQLLVHTTGKAVGGIVPSMVDSIHEVLRSVSPERV